MTYDFDTHIERRGTGSIKWDAAEPHFGRPNLLPMWVADMDFPTPPFIREAVRRRMDHPVYGYCFAPESYWNAIIWWEQQLHQWEIAREWICYIPGIVKGIGMALLCFTRPGDKIIIQEPVYMPFRWVPEKMGRQVAVNPLVWDQNRYRMDFDQLGSALDDAKVLILSNPHNPAGRVWEKETLQQLAEMCAAKGVLVISDEIHADMALSGHKHCPFAAVSETAARIGITFCAPSKTFNIAGLVSSFAVVPDPVLRQTFFSWLEACEMEAATFVATSATEAAFSPDGLAWRNQMLRYVEGNIRYLASFFADNDLGITAVCPEASFLVWLDCRAKKLSQPSLENWFLDRGLALNSGTDFGIGGEGFMRINVGCPRVVLEKAVEALSR